MYQQPKQDQASHLGSDIQKKNPCNCYIHTYEVTGFNRSEVIVIQAQSIFIKFYIYTRDDIFSETVPIIYIIKVPNLKSLWHAITGKGLEQSASVLQNGLIRCDSVNCIHNMNITNYKRIINGPCHERSEVHAINVASGVEPAAVAWRYCVTFGTATRNRYCVFDNDRRRVSCSISLVTFGSMV